MWFHIISWFYYVIMWFWELLLDGIQTCKMNVVTSLKFNVFNCQASAENTKYLLIDI